MRGITQKDALMLLLLVALILLDVSIAYAQSTSIVKNNYEITPDRIDKKIQIARFDIFEFLVRNKVQNEMTVNAVLEGSAADTIKLSQSRFTIPSFQTGTINLTIFANEFATYNGTLILTGSVNERIPISIKVIEEGDEVEALSIRVRTLEQELHPKDKVKFVVTLENLLAGNILNTNLTYSLKKIDDPNTIIFQNTEGFALNSTKSIFYEEELGKIPEGEYVLETRGRFLGKEALAATRISVELKLLDKKLFGIIPLKYILLLLILGVAGYFGYRYYQKKQASKKRYQYKMFYNELPQPGPRSVKIGKIAETNRDAYFDIDQLKMHTLIAGSTGGGKTVSAEVLIEEALIKGSAAIIFDPTAQWSGFLRKNTEKKMFDLYPKFNMKPSDARAFNGNVKQIKDEREFIEIVKYIKPGEMTVFAINRLTPDQIDILVANTLKQVFSANLPEAKDLKLLIIFDEVHRLLPKFGGSGQGFLQIERGAREFRKWGVGLMLISQVLTDFIGETKANIANEVQMRTRDQGDLNRIKTKYGDYMLQSLLKSATGTGMIENANYNRGEPYFVAFRPLLHMHAALPDEELENYNKYNDIVDDLEFEINQLEEAKMDVFDLKLELKLALDKVKSGNFNMAGIYLDGLKPRITSQFEKAGIKPKKREKKLIDVASLKAEFEKAKAAREKAAAKSKGAEEEKKEEAPKEFQPLRLESGLVVVNPVELEDSLASYTAAHFAKQVTAEKNDFAEWAKEVEPELSKKLTEIKSKEDLINVLKEWNSKAKEKKEEEKEEEKKE